MTDKDPHRKGQLRRRFQGIHQLLTSSTRTSHAACTIQSTHQTGSMTYTPQPASHALTTQTLELVRPHLTQHGREVESPPTTQITVSSDLLLKLREEIEILKSEVKDLKKGEVAFKSEVRELKEEVARLKAAPPPVATPPPQNQYKHWLERSLNIAGAIDSRSPPTHSYDCALHGSDGSG